MIFRMTKTKQQCYTCPMKASVSTDGTYCKAIECLYEKSRESPPDKKIEKYCPHCGKKIKE
jgi:ribosomal protein L33